MRLIQYIQQNNIQKVLALLVFCFWIGLFYQKIDVTNKLPDRPGGEHAWAQIDRASMALTYHKDQASFWLPRCHQARENTEGITAGEFPLIPYTVSNLYDTWGFNEIYHRAFVLGITLVGFLFSFLLALRFIRSPFWAALVAALWIASPNIIYYSISFLPDTPALAFTTISLYFLCKKEENASYLDLILFALFFSLAALIKVSTILPISAVAFALFITSYNKKFAGWKNKIKLLFAISVPLLLTAMWIIYARHIVDKYHIFTFLMKPVPPTSWANFNQGINTFIDFIYYYYIDGFRFFLAIATLIGLVFIRRSNVFLFLSAIFIYIGGFIFFIVMFEKSPTHFYYWVPFQLGIFFNLAWLVDLLSKSRLPIWGHVALWVGTLLFINYNAIHVGKNVGNRWQEGQELVKYYDLEPTLESLHIHYEDRVFSYLDVSFNNTLYLMNRKGIIETSADNIQQIQKDLMTCDYAVLNDTTLLHNSELRPFFKQRLAEHDSLYIYKLSSEHLLENP